MYESMTTVGAKSPEAGQLIHIQCAKISYVFSFHSIFASFIPSQVTIRPWPR